MNNAKTGNIFNILRFCTADGDGVRTLVFFKGCPLNCKWCHNPEGLCVSPQLSYDKTICIGCGKCLSICKNNCHKFTNEHIIDYSKCSACGQCAVICPTGALEMLGKHMSVNEILQEVKRDVFFYATDGGVTLSGGEVLMQADFALNLISALKKQNIGVMLETSGCINTKTARKVLSNVDCVLLDYKLWDKALLKLYTGLNYDVLMDNLNYLQAIGKRTVLRCPIINGVNFNDEHLIAVASIAQRYSCIQEVNILPYHNLGIDKAKRISMPFIPFEILDRNKIKEFADKLSKHTEKPVKIIF